MLNTAMAIEHKHLVVRAEIQKPIFDEPVAMEFITKLIEKINMKVMHGPVAKYCRVEGNKGMTAFAIIETSHIAMHIWDESWPAVAQLDVYSCSDFEPDTVFEHLQQLDPLKIDYKFLNRKDGFTEI